MRSHAAPPTRERALQLADALIHGGRRLWTSECDEIANYIRAQAELGDVLALDAPSATNVTDYEILRLARSYRDGSATDGERRQTCILALGIGPPVTSIGVRSPDLIAQARAWCALGALRSSTQAQMESVGASPDPIDGPERHRPVRVRPSDGHPIHGIVVALGQDGQECCALDDRQCALWMATLAFEMPGDHWRRPELVKLERLIHRDDRGDYDELRTRIA